MKLSSRDLGIALALSAAGVVAATATGCSTKKAEEPAVKDAHLCAGKNSCKGLGGCKTDKNACAGMNACKGLGGCASTAARHSCAGKNECKGMGGCKTDKNSCAGTNACRGLGGCAIPKKH